MMKDDVFTEEPRAVETDYETERNKPMPNIIHGTIQTKISVLLTIQYGDRFDFPNLAKPEPKGKNIVVDFGHEK